jgi:predicted MFS family arabinose efflux permease
VIGRRWSIFGLCAGAYFLSQFFRSANAVLARDLADELVLSAAQLGLMTSLFYASFSAAQLPLGQALDRLGARLVTPLLMLVAVGGSLLFASAHSFGGLAAGRMLMGLGMAGVFVGSVKLFSHWFPPGRFASASGYLVAVGSLGALSAGAPLAWLNESFGWRAVFVLGAAAISVSALALFLGARDQPPGTETTQPEPDEGGLLTVVRSLTFWRLAFLDFFMVGTLLSVQGLWGGPFLLDVVGTSKVEAGNYLTMLSLGALVGYIVCGRLADRLGPRRIAITGGTLFTAAQAALILLHLLPVRSLVAPVFIVFGFSGAFNILLKAHARAAFPLCLTGRAVTAVNLFGIGGAFVIQWVQGLVIDAFGRLPDGGYPLEAYATAFALTTFGTLLAVLFYLSGSPLPRRLRLRRILVRG